MDVQGLLYNSDLASTSSSSASSRGIMAPHLDVNGQPYVQAHHPMPEFDSFPAPYPFDSGVAQYQNVLGHAQQTFHTPYPSHPHPHAHHNPHNAHQHPQHQAHQQVHHHHQHHHPQQHQQHHTPTHPNSHNVPPPLSHTLPHHPPHPQQQPHPQHHGHPNSQPAYQASTIPLRRAVPVVVPTMPRDVRNSTPRARPTPARPPPNPKPESSTTPSKPVVPYTYPQQEAATPEAQKPPPKPATEIEFKTDVDNLMKTIQSKAPPRVEEPKQRAKPQQVSPVSPTNAYPPTNRDTFNGQYGNDYTQSPQQVAQYGVPRNMGVDKLLAEDGEKKGAQKPKKRYECDFEGCNKSFFQKTHLEIHIRAHSGDKPYTCSEPGCGQRFSQMGNLKTHQRRHTGERPFSCEHCGKKFAQRGNVRAHKIVHEGAKPFTCRLDSCGKQFTQLGNLKSHQNKFHAATLRTLTEKFATIREPEQIHPGDKDLFDYFADLYKNSNKGIKGRGKDRKIATTRKPVDDGEGSGGHLRDEMITSPGSCGSGSNAEAAYEFPHEIEDESGVDSPYHETQQHLPPLQPGPRGMVMAQFPDDGMSMTDMAKYNLDRKFQL